MANASKKVVVVGIAILWISISARAANNAEQVIYSTPGFLMQLSGNQHASSTPFGFWVWCAAEAAETSRGGYQNANACQGNMYFYALDTHATPPMSYRPRSRSSKRTASCRRLTHRTSARSRIWIPTRRGPTIEFRSTADFRPPSAVEPDLRS